MLRSSSVSYCSLSLSLWLLTLNAVSSSNGSSHAGFCGAVLRVGVVMSSVVVAVVIESMFLFVLDFALADFVVAGSVSPMLLSS